MADARVTVLEDASLSVDAGELVAVWGLRGSAHDAAAPGGRIDAPDSGAVRFDGRDLAEHGEKILGREIGYCQKSFRTAAPDRDAIEEVIVGLLVNGVAPAAARVRARDALERVGGERLARRRVRELDSAERVRLAIAHALALGPRLLLVDEPVAGVDLYQRDDVLLLARSLADQGVAVLMTVGELTGPVRRRPVADDRRRRTARQPQARAGTGHGPQPAAAGERLAEGRKAGPATGLDE